MSARPRLALALAAALAAACSSGGGAPDGGAATAGSASAVVSFSRDGGLATSPGDAGLAPPATASPEALDELLAATPKSTGGATGADGGTRVGSDTGKPQGDATDEPSAAAPQAPPRKAEVGVGTPRMAPEVASPAVERDGRAQLYWSLTQRCRGKDGKILPPEVVTLHFTLDPDGVILPATIQALPSAPQYAEAAQCMLRELAASKFRASASSRGVAARVTATVPSVD